MAPKTRNSQTPSPAFPSSNPYADAPAQPKNKKKHRLLGWVAGIAGVFIIGSALTGTGDGSSSGRDAADATVSTSPTVAVEAANIEKSAPIQDAVLADAPVADTTKNDSDVPLEYKNALRSAKNYLRFSGFSERGLYDQLTSEYAEQYSPEAAQYALDNVDADYFEEAEQAAKNYQDFMPMSGPALFDQLTSEYGDKFTEKQAQHAVDALGL